MFSIIVVDEGIGAVVVAIPVTLVSWYHTIVIFLDVGAGAVVVLFLVILVNNVENKTIVLDNDTGSVVLAVVVNDEGAGAIESTHPAFIWERGIMTTLVYWLMDVD